MPPSEGIQLTTAEHRHRRETAIYLLILLCAFPLNLQKPAKAESGFQHKPNAAFTAFGPEWGRAIHGGGHASIVFNLEFLKTCQHIATLQEAAREYALAHGYFTYPEGTDIHNLPKMFMYHLSHGLSAEDYEWASTQYEIAIAHVECRQLQLACADRNAVIRQFYEDTEEGQIMAQNRGYSVSNMHSAHLNPYANPYRSPGSFAISRKLLFIPPPVVFALKVVASLLISYAFNAIVANRDQTVEKQVIKVAKAGWYVGRTNRELAWLTKDIVGQFKSETDHRRAVARAARATQMARDTIRSTTRVLDAAANGKFSSELLLDYDLRRAHAELQRLADEANMMIPTETALSWASSLATYVTTAEGADLVLTIPLTHPSQELSIFPYASVASRRVNDQFLRIDQPKFAYIGVSQDGRYWTGYTTADLQLCTPIAGFRFCPHKTVLNKAIDPDNSNRYKTKNHEICLYALYDKNLPLIENTCTIAVADSEEMVQVSDTDYIIGSPNPGTKATIHCPHSVATGGSITLHENNAISLNPQCSMETPEHYATPLFSLFQVTAVKIVNLSSWPLSSLKSLFQIQRTPKEIALDNRIEAVVANASAAEQLAREAHTEAQHELSPKGMAFGTTITVGLIILVLLIAFLVWIGCINGPCLRSVAGCLAGQIGQSNHQSTESTTGNPDYVASEFVARRLPQQQTTTIEEIHEQPPRPAATFTAAALGHEARLALTHVPTKRQAPQPPTSSFPLQRAHSVRGSAYR